jgi:hypothetical protein
MFRRIVATNAAPVNPNNIDIDKDRAENLFKLHPSELGALLEMAWEFRKHDPGKGSIGHPDFRSNLTELPEKVLALFNEMTRINRASFKADNLGGVRWDHLIYAYLIENTKVYDIFGKVLEAFLHGEKLGVPTPDAHHWLRNTEALFYSNPTPFSIFSTYSLIRPDMGATRRNAYYRMFGMDLNHGTSDGKPYPYAKAEAANRNFANSFREFCEEVWIAIEHFGNTSGVRKTDPASIAFSAKQLHDMFTTRRRNGELSRVEFFAVSMMSWFHLTLQFDSPIVEALRAEAASPEQRLFKIAERVGIPAHAHSESFFRMADALSRIFIQIETGAFNDLSSAQALFDPASQAERDMRDIITHWSIATGQDLKVRRGKNLTQLTNPTAQPVSANGNGALVS